MKTYRQIITEQRGYSDLPDEKLKKLYNQMKDEQLSAMAASQFKLIVAAMKKRGINLNEVTVAGTGVGSYSAPIGMSKRDAETLKFGQYTKNMSRKEMLSQCRKMGLSVGNLSDAELRKTLSGMGVHSKRKFIGTSKGMGMGSVDRWTMKPVKVKRA